MRTAEPTVTVRDAERLIQEAHRLTVAAHGQPAVIRAGHTHYGQSTVDVLTRAASLLRTAACELEDQAARIA